MSQEIYKDDHPLDHPEETLGASHISDVRTAPENSSGSIHQSSSRVEELLEVLREFSLRDLRTFTRGFTLEFPEMLAGVYSAPLPREFTNYPVASGNLRVEPSTLSPPSGLRTHSPKDWFQRDYIPLEPSSGEESLGGPGRGRPGAPGEGSGSTRRTAIRKARKSLREAALGEPHDRALRAYQSLCGRLGKDPAEGFPEYPKFADAGAPPGPIAEPREAPTSSQLPQFPQVAPGGTGGSNAGASRGSSPKKDSSGSQKRYFKK